MSDNQYQIGDTVRMSVEWTVVETGAFFDPTTTRVIVKEPDGTETAWNYPVDPEVVKDSAGHYHLDFTTDQDGTHRYVIRGLNAGGTVIVATEDGRFRARQSTFAL